MKHMDRIIVLQERQIVEDGTHAELLKKGSQYAEFWKHQSHGFLVPDNGDKIEKSSEGMEEASQKMPEI